ncbi:MAG: FtsQ-type POTRA domain-containing protein [Clostridium sp.]|nr:FtsQ-type POTRA domain-containing protein [Clostridium sp.]MCM1444321.1 FtsQ-type POTRA domain-containing protein [Candidatus Amulumruptor caecigallinarius]
MANMTRSQKYNTKNTYNNKNIKINKSVKSKKNANNIKQNNIKQKKKFKIKYKTLFIFIIIFLIVIYAFISFLRLKITNIYISGNNILEEREIIDIAKISDYPNTFLNLSFVLKNRLESNIYIKSAKVYKKWFTIVYIEVEENRPLFYNDAMKETVLIDGKTVNEQLKCPILINLIPDTLYQKFVIKMSNIDINVLNRISEIKYDKNDVDDTRFLFTMDDGNYVYLSLNQFEKINDYFNIIENINGAKGILYLDSGEYFQIFEN